ncbi:protein BUNDLE SHEATH DEFECTIVE 2, chloroplastic-like isoform X1 [Bidens hawaiensis]|uniref:protein BUNDLE SHEATH DEFECTIVE 2, chloroplastic-like isoform X1 n=1 Tax=Bidens hawaiensis TaxID=980011 RepID=UPI00404A1032
MRMALSPPCLCLISIPVDRYNPGVFIGIQPNRRTLKFDILKPKATGDDKESKPKKRSVICTDCDGNGTIQCSQCKGSGVNSEDFFNGKFKIGDSCWLCGGRQEMLCGTCNGAGFVGGFLSGFDN